MRITEVNKAIVGGLALILALVNDAVADNVLDASEGQTLFVNLVSIILGVWAVYRVPNADAKKGTPREDQ